MRRRASGSSAEEEESQSQTAAPANNADKNKSKNRSMDNLEEKRMDVKSGNQRRSVDSATRPEPNKDSGKTTARRSLDKTPSLQPLDEKREVDTMAEHHLRHRARLRSPWSCSLLTLACTAISFLILITIVQSFLTRQLDPKGCAMSYMRAAFAKFDDFDTEYTRFASKYSLYLYREGGIDEDTRVKGIPVLFIPGNAGSYKQVRPIAAEAAYHFHDVLQNDPDALNAGKRALDFFSVDFNEDITAFHGQTLLDQAEYLNDAIAYILALYHNPHRSIRDPSLPDPTSVIVIGHSMGGIVGRTMLTRPNYLANSINTILTLSAPHARAPVSFDSDIVNIYRTINDYWRQSYSEQWASKNPLWHVTLVSIAGGGLDTVVPSDYASLTSLVPDTHGFTVFTSSIPHVWTGMDHLAIMWCDQLRKVIVKALYDIADVHRPSQTRSRAERIQIFRKRFLTGMEPVVDKALPGEEARMLLTLEDESTAILSHGQRLRLDSLGQSGKVEAHVLPIPLQEPSDGKRFTLLTDQNLDGGSNLEAFFCSVHPHQHGQSASLFAMNMDLSDGNAGSTRLACKSAAPDVIAIPASYSDSNTSFDDRQPFSYLQYDLADLTEYQFVAIIDKANEPAPGWVIAEFSTKVESTMTVRRKLRRLLTRGVHKELPASRPLVNELHIPVVHSSLLAYHLNVEQACQSGNELFRPLLRQYISEPYESKYFLNPQNVNVNLHGVSPYVPPPTSASGSKDGLSLQIWSDPTCNSTMKVSLDIDILGSAGKLVMRYRTVFAAFPLVVVALVLRKQFKIYNATGVFISFTEAMDQCIRTSLPLLFVALTFLATSLSRPDRSGIGEDLLGQPTNSSETFTSFTKNELLLGSHDSFFWFLVPLFGFISVGVCIVLNYVTLALTHVITLCYRQIRHVSLRNDEGRRTSAAFAVTSPLQRIVTTSVLVLMVATIIPYQFAYMVLCLVQLATCVRALRLAWDTRSPTNSNFYNYTHSFILLMLWILPINIPVLVVWIHNLAVHWLTPFSSHHNILSIMPYILLVETMSTGHMVPRITGRVRIITNVLLFVLALYAAVYGVSYAYQLHQLVNGLCAWLVVIHAANGSCSPDRFREWVGHSTKAGGAKVKKRP